MKNRESNPEAATHSKHIEETEMTSTEHGFNNTFPIEVTTKSRRIDIRTVAFIVVACIFALCQGIFCFVWTRSRTSFILPVLLGILCSFLLIWFSLSSETGRIDEKVILRAWVITCSVLGCLYCFLMPVGCVPDEDYHYKHSYMYSDILLGQEFETNSLTMRRCDAEIDVLVSTDVYANADDYRAVMNTPIFASEADAQQITHTFDHRSLSFSSNWPQIRLPSALGITLGRVLNLNGFLTFYLGRLFNLGYYMALVYAAIRISTIGRNAFIAVSLLPMTLHLAASLSYDATAIGFAFLLTALCLKVASEEGPVSRKDLIGILVVLFLTVPAKLVYSFVALLALFTPSDRFSSKKNAIRFRLILVAVFVLTCAASQLSRLLSVANSVYDSDREYVLYTPNDLLIHPMMTIRIFINTFGTLSSSYLTQMIAGPLGWFQGNLNVPLIISIAFVVLMLYSGLANNNDRLMPNASLRTMMLVIAGVVVFAVMSSMLLGCTSVDSDFIEGVQGRYFIPIMPLLLMGLRPRDVRIVGEGSRVTLVSAAFLNAITISTIYASVLMG